MPPRTPDPRTLIPEKQVIRACLAVCRLLNVDAKRQNAGRLTLGHGAARRAVYVGRKDDPDISAVLPGGRACGIEVKRFGKQPRPGQIARLIALNQMGGVGLWVDSAETLHRVLPALIAGARVVMREDGHWTVVSGEG